MDPTNPSELIEPKWREAFARFVETGDAEGDFLDYLNSDPQAQAGVEQAFSRQAAALEEFAGAMSAALSGAPVSSTASASGRPSLVRRSMSYLAPAALAACVLLSLLTIRFANVTRQTQRELMRAESEQRQQAETFKIELAAAQTERDTFRVAIQRAELRPGASQGDRKKSDEALNEAIEVLSNRAGELASAEQRFLTIQRLAQAATPSSLTAAAPPPTSVVGFIAGQELPRAVSTASPTALYTIPTWVSSNFQDGALELDRVQDRNYAASWTKGAFITDFKVDASGRVINTEVVKHSQTVDAKPWVLGNRGVVPTVKTFDGKSLPSNVTCIVLPTAETSGDK